jgi:tRNA nucleotidyltransferase (CCA-adding enzyme)
MVKNMAEQENFTKCLVEGYQLNNTIQSLRNHIGVFKDVLERATATPIDIEIIKEMEKNIKSHLKKIRETPCMTKEMQNAVGIETMIIFKDYDVDLVFIPPDHPRIDTLLHTEFMNQNLTPELKKEVIRAKAFFKSSGVYGAEIGGIVGVAIEELIRRHGNLEKVCTVLLSSSDVPFIPDPAKPERNLLASIKKIRWKQIQTVCDGFLKSRTFKYRPYTKTEYLADRHEWNHIHFQRKRDRPTDFHSALSACNHALNEVKNREPEVKGTCDAYVFDEVLISYDVTPKQLPRQKLHCGPPLEMHESVRAFKTIYPETFEKDGKVCTLI